MHDKLWKGVNLGGWLVLERWITPELFDGLFAQDEGDFCEELGESKTEKLKSHRQSYITSEDFKWIAEHGFNAVRIPVPHWIFGGYEPFVGCAEYLDFAINAAQDHQLKVVIDLHTAPGSQNGYDHSGRAGEVAWHKDDTNINQTLAAIEQLASRYGRAGSLAGIELLNEPSPKISHDTLVGFYKQGYELVRKHAGETVAVIISDAYRPRDWAGSFDASYKNLMLDVHLYQAFGWLDKRKSIQKVLKTVSHEWRELILQIQKDLPVIVGEWSLGLDNKVFRGMGDFERDKALQAYGSAQMDTFSTGYGWFFWTYKTANMAGWSLREAMKLGWIKIN